jgi:hypothetical protein
MPVVVTLTLNEKTVLVEAEKVDKDPYLETNLLLFGTKGLSVPAPDGASFITTVWSVPKAQIKFYAVGRREPPPPPPLPPVSPPEDVPVSEMRLVSEMPDFVREAGEALARDRGEAPPEAPAKKSRSVRKKKAATSASDEGVEIEA